MTMPADVLYSILSKKENAHDNSIYCCDWIKCSNFGDSANNAKDYIVTGSLDNLVKVWILQNNKLQLLHVLKGHNMGVISVAVNPSNLTIVSASLDSHIILWGLMSGKNLMEIPIDVSDVWKVVFSPDGSEIATGGSTGIVYAYTVHDSRVSRVLDTRGTFILSMDWSSNGKYIVTGSVNGVVCIIDVIQGKVLHTIEAHSDAIRAICFAPCNKSIITASNDGNVKIYEIISGGFECKLELKTWAVSVCFAPDGKHVAIGAADGTVTIALGSDLTLVNTFNEHEDIVWGVRFAKNSRKFISVSKDKSINLYDCPPLPEVAKQSL